MTLPGKGKQKHSSEREVSGREGEEGNGLGIKCEEDRSKRTGMHGGGHLWHKPET